MTLGDAQKLYEAFRSCSRQGLVDDRFFDHPSVDAIFAATPETQREVLLRAFKDPERLGYYEVRCHTQVLQKLIKAPLEFTESDFATMLKSNTCQVSSGLIGSLLAATERYSKKNELSEELRQDLRNRSAALARDDELPRKTVEKVRSRISNILGEEFEDTFRVVTREPWAERLSIDVHQLQTHSRAAMTRIINHAGTATAGKPTKSWQREAANRIAGIDTHLVAAAFTVWFEAFDEPATEPGNDYQHSEWSVSSLNADVLKGLIWTAALLKDEGLIRAIGKAGQSGQRKIPGLGPRSNKVTNAAIWALGQIDDPLAISQLSILKSRIKNKAAQKQITKAMTAVAVRIGVPPEEVEEMAVPTFGLTELGKRIECLGEYTAELVIRGTDTTELRWIKPDGKTQKSVPQSVKVNFRDELKDLRSAAKDIRKLLPTQRERIDSLFLDQKVWPYADWQERYLEQPLVGVLTRRIIWVFETAGESTAAIWLEDNLVDVTGEEVQILAESTTVRLWHPIEEPPSTIVAWREFLESHQITQPFKQAHREIYLLTDAERSTNIYSNRFAAHILKQHQFNAICAARRWRNSLRLLVDDTCPPASRELPSWNLRAEFWIEGAGDTYGVDTNETGTFLYLSTDQVRFYDISATENSAHVSGGGYSCETSHRESVPEPIPVSDIPPLVFSEIMRDVDLFVGVTSVGNDPNWISGGREVRYRGYWQDYSFGELNGTANTRKQILEQLIPRLKIASQCSFDDKFLVVEGAIRTYKIHLGSGNILMKPNDQYLCIVPNPSAITSSTNRVFLPFEGDRTLSIILSKALLLAEDSKITDSTILSQIES